MRVASVPKATLFGLAACLFALAGVVNLFSPVKLMSVMWFGLGILYFALSIRTGQDTKR